jgi:putrescine transport system permease protein
MGMTKVSKTSLSFLIFGYSFLYLPIAIVILGSFNDSEVQGVWTKFSMRWFREIMRDTDLLDAAAISLEIAAISATISVILGSLSAAVTTRTSNRLLGNIIAMPVLMPEVIIGFSLLMLFISLKGVINLQNGIVTTIIGHSVLTTGYVYMTLKPSFMHFDKSLEEVAMNLGGSPATVFWSVKIPIMKKALVAAWLLAFTLSLDDLVVASFLGGPGSTTLPILIFSSIRLGTSPTINVLTTVFFAIKALFIIIAYTVSNKASNVTERA